jgi:hypothetical protein
LRYAVLETLHAVPATGCDDEKGKEALSLFFLAILAIFFEIRRDETGVK